jgi:2-C-methyl-D-erythritol 4-phosphate cytidylyltransferase
MGPKQYTPLAGRPLVAHTLAALAAVPGLTNILVVTAPDDPAFAAAAPNFAGWVAAVGGATRADSVANGLAVLRGKGADDDDWVLVHDAARCLVQPEDIRRLIDACLCPPLGGSNGAASHPVGGLLAVPVPDTVKRAQPGGATPAVAQTIARDGLWLAQTPQMFRLGMLQTALLVAKTKRLPVTDEASAIEAMGHAPLLVEGHADNFKVTYPADFVRAERLLKGLT